MEWGAGVVFELPLALREARGAYRAARAELGAVDAELRQLRDQIAAELRAARVALETSRRAVALADAHVNVAHELAAAERTRLREGASDLLAVNLRELAVADAELARIDALATFQHALIDYRVALGSI